MTRINRGRCFARVIDSRNGDTSATSGVVSSLEWRAKNGEHVGATPALKHWQTMSSLIIPRPRCSRRAFCCGNVRASNSHLVNFCAERDKQLQAAGSESSVWVQSKVDSWSADQVSTLSASMNAAFETLSQKHEAQQENAKAADAKIIVLEMTVNAMAPAVTPCEGEQQP